MELPPRDPKDKAEYDELERYVQTEVLSKLKQSRFVISLGGGDGMPTLQGIIETGAAVLFDKPIMVVVKKGQTIPATLAQLAVRIVEADIVTDEGKLIFEQALKEEMEILLANGPDES